MPLYRVRNNLDYPVYLPTRRDGIYRLSAHKTETLDLVSPNSRRLRGLQQSVGLTIAPAVNPLTGRKSPPLPDLHFNKEALTPPLPPIETTPATGQSGAVSTDMSRPGYINPAQLV